jgi:hypothetical protein
MCAMSIEMATNVLSDKMFGPDGQFKVLPAGVVVGRPRKPATGPIPTFTVPMPSKPKIESGVKAPATKCAFGHVRISTYPKHLAGMDPAGFMT